MSEVLDRSKTFSPVQGDSLAAYYQSGNYFAADDSLISDESAGKPSENGSFINQVEARVEEEAAKENAKKPLTLIDNQNPKTNSPATIAAAQARAASRKAKEVDETTTPVTEIDPLQAKRTELQALHVSQLREMVVVVGLIPVTGLGSKAANIKLLLENTE